MGTSSSSKGPRGRNPLIPSFLGGPAAGGSGGGDGSNGDGNGDDGASPSGSDRYKTARSNFSRYAASGGSDHASLGRAISNYIRRSSGGAGGASQKMTTSKSSASRLAGVLSAAATSSPQEALRQVGLGSLAGRPSNEIFEALVDVICPEGGTIDEAIARDAYVETIAALDEQGGIDFNALQPAQVEAILESFIAKSIDAKVCNEIGNRGISVPQTSATAQRVQDQLQDFIEGAVHDAMVGIRERGGLVFGNHVEAIVNDIYQYAFDMLLTAAEQLEQLEQQA